MFRGRLFHTDKDVDVLGLYSTQSNVVYATPEGTEHLAHVGWTNLSTGKRCSIDYFDVFDKSKISPGEFVDLRINGIDTAYEKKFSGDYQILGEYRKAADLVRAITIEDIKMFIGQKKLRKNIVEAQPRIGFVDNIPAPALVSRGEATIRTSGKQDFSPNRVCVFGLNLDYADFCVSGTSTDGKLAPWQECLFCYADYMHKGFPNILRVDRKNLVEQMNRIRGNTAGGERPLVMRLGKRTDAGAPMFAEHLDTTLEACLECGIPVVIPSKFLEFRKDTARLLRETGSTYLVSFGNDDLEPGAVSFGRTQKARIESVVKYREAGVRAIPYILRDVTLADGGEYFRENVARLPRMFPQVQFLGLRLRHEDKSKKIYGGWHRMVKRNCGGNDLFGQEDGRFVKGPDGTLIAPNIHQSLAQMIGDNNGDRARLCSHDQCDWQCGKCFVGGEKGTIISDWRKYLPVVKKFEGKPVKMADPSTFKLVAGK